MKALLKIFILLLFLAILKLTTSSSILAADPMDQWVTHVGGNLMLNGKIFRFGGGNIHWLSVDDNYGNSIPTAFRIDDAFGAAEEMGMTVVRGYNLGISVGAAYSLEPSRGVFNDNHDPTSCCHTPFDAIDYAIYSARQHHIRLIIPLMDEWHFTSGGKHFFTDWNGISDENEFFDYQELGAATYGNAVHTMLQDYKTYVAHILNHKNVYTGIVLKNDPVIMAWETGNEMFIDGNAKTLKPYCSISGWTEYLASYIKGDPASGGLGDTHHLIIDGFSANGNSTHIDPICTAGCPDVDMVDGHYYPNASKNMGLDYITKFMEVDANSAYNNNKVFIVGEYDWTGWNSTTPTLAEKLAAVENNPVNGSHIAGDMLWDIESHGDKFGFIHNSQNGGTSWGWAMHYPSGGLVQDTPDTKARASIIRAHNYFMAGLSLPPSSITAAPIVTVKASTTAGSVYIYWRGVVGADYYQVEHSTDHGVTWTVFPTHYTDAIDVQLNSSWKGYLISGDASDEYRVAGINVDGVKGIYGYSSLGGDANSDGRVDGVDYVLWLNGDARADFNADGKINGTDYSIWLSNYLKN